MKKIVIGMIIGSCLMFSSQAFGEEISLIGRKISKEVKVKMLGDELEKKAIILDGVTYVPLRVISESFGLDVAYVDGEVVVKRPNEEYSNLLTTIDLKKTEIEKLKKGIGNINKDIEYLEQVIIDNPGKTDYLTGLSPSDQIGRKKELIKETEQQLTKLESELAILEAKKVELSPLEPVESPALEPTPEPASSTALEAQQ